jgi:hypothetical protein
MIRPKDGHYPLRVLALIGGFILLVGVVLAVGWLQRLQETSTEWVRQRAGSLAVVGSLAHIAVLRRPFKSEVAN